MKLAVASASKLSLEFYRSCQNALIANPVYSLSANDVEAMASLPVDVANSLVKDYIQDGKIVIDKDELNSLFNTSYRNCDDRTDFAKAYQTALNYFTRRLFFSDANRSDGCRTRENVPRKSASVARFVLVFLVRLGKLHLRLHRRR